MAKPKAKDKAEKLSEVKWRRITAPLVWRPVAGEELIGYYVGRTKRDGAFGQYEVVVIAVPYKGTFTVSGTGLLNLVDSGMVTRGQAIRIFFGGYLDLGEGKQMKQFELYVGETERADDLPPECTTPTREAF